MRWVWIARVGLALLATVAGCSDDEPPPQVALEGDWDGSVEDQIGRMHAFAITINGDGNVSAMVIDGKNGGNSAVLSHLGEANFAFAAADGTQGGIFADRGRAHFLYADSRHYVGVLRRGPGETSGPFTQDHFAGSWIGQFTVVNESWALASTGTVAAGTEASGDFAATNRDGGTFSGNATLSSALYGRYSGTYTTIALQEGSIRFVLSPDNRFMGAYGCTPGSTFPAACEFNMWVRVDL